jgi:hypothetical protein
MCREDWQPAYIRLEQGGELAHRAAALYATLRRCRLCPRQCGVNRLKGEKGICESSSRVKVASAQAHFGEERPLVGRFGSGTIFCKSWRMPHADDQLHVCLLAAAPHTSPILREIEKQCGYGHHAC